MSIASLFSKSDSKSEEQELADWMLEKYLDETTDVVWEDVYFNREDENAWIYAESASSNDDAWEDEDEERDYDSMAATTAYELLKHDFHKIEEDKRKAFLEWEYDDIDVFNDKLLGIQSKLEKLSKLLGEEI